MACNCLQCGSPRTAAAYYCSADDLGWVMVNPDSDPNTGRPTPAQCPDHLYQATDNDPTAFEAPACCRNLVQPKTLYCFDCGAVEVFEP